MTQEPASRSARRSGFAWKDEGVIVLVAVALAAVDTVIHVAGPPTTGWAGPYAFLVLVLLLDVAIVFLPRFPRQVAGLALVITAILVVAEAVQPGLATPADPISQVRIPTAVPFIIWYLVRYRDRSTILAVVPALVVLGGQLWLPSWDVTPMGLLSTLVPALLALYFRSRSQLVQSLRDRAERSEREAQLLAEQARLEERSRLATEMHDVVSHRISLIVLRAGALGVRSQNSAVLDATEDIRGMGTRALEELRDVVGVLRGESPAERPDAGNADGPRPPDLDPATLAADSETVGVSVDLRVEGDAATVPLPVRRTAYRVLQEGLTNIRKHAPGADVRVEVTYAPDGVAVLVQDWGPTEPVDEALADSGTGTGLAGLRHRVESMGGRLDACPHEGGYWLRAAIPATAPVADEPL